MDIRQIMAIDSKNKKLIKSMYPNITDESGIYIFARIENDIKYAYIGQARHLLTRIAQHLRGYQHIDLSIKKHGWYTCNNPAGYRIVVKKCEESELDSQEQFYIKECAKTGYQLRNKTAGGQGEGKMQINEYRPAKGYRDGIRQGENNIKKALNHIISNYLTIALKKDNIRSQKALQKFWEILKVEVDDESNL